MQTHLRGCSSMVEPEPSKLMTRVRFPSPAPENKPSQVYLARFLFGTWRSLVARLLWEQDVAGSNPVVPTIVFFKPASCRLFYALAIRLVPTCSNSSASLLFTAYRHTFSQVIMIRSKNGYYRRPSIELLSFLARETRQKAFFFFAQAVFFAAYIQNFTPYINI